MPPPPRPQGVQVGGAFVESGFLWLFGVVEPGSHDVYLGRVAADAAARGVLQATRWWDGNQFGPASRAERIAHDVQTELTVHRASDGMLWMTSTRGFGAADVVIRRASSPQGPWSAPERLHRPAEGRESGVLVYSAKAHPHLQASSRDSVWVTYCTNHLDFFTQASRQDLYFPRFLRVDPAP